MSHAPGGRFTCSVHILAPAIYAERTPRREAARNLAVLPTTLGA